MNPTRYNNIVTTVMKLAFRKLEEFLKSTNHTIVSLNSAEEKIIRAPLTNCEKWMRPEELETFYKFIKLACNLEKNQEIQVPVAVMLYNSCVRQLQQKQASDELGPRKGRKKKVREEEKEIDGSYMGGSVSLPYNKWAPSR
jgi:hypothetical protein